jgi:hypothetical protein
MWEYWINGNETISETISETLNETISALKTLDALKSGLKNWLD